MIDLTKVLTLAFPNAEVVPWSTPTEGVVRGTVFGTGTVSLYYSDLTGLFTARFEPRPSRGVLVADGETPEIAVEQLFAADAERLRELSQRTEQAGREAWDRMTRTEREVV